ncbi:hypothetical protein EVAR_23799_1 [Eumeta japonica]|uniref:Uncharacterized protein n=1 Tax=Eumeta variegata TaxID=151549 RepID=A0A4C1VK16_EUMVA|nr:hypothetical protein EVAR_23799_1 [Eumeta japonica]
MCEACLTFTNKNPRKLNISFRYQPKGCRQLYQTRPIDIVMPSALDSPTRVQLESSQLRKSCEIAQGTDWPVAGGKVAWLQIRPDAFRLIQTGMNYPLYRAANQRPPQEICFLFLHLQ